VYQKENKLAAKHIVEEAMTEAFVRKCNKCNQAFVKEEGCNKMKCPCGNLQCYVCSSNVVDYSHFEPEMRCPLYGDMQQLLKEQVAIAQERTVRELLQTGAGLEDNDVRVDEKADTNYYNRIHLEVPRPPPTIQPPLQQDFVNRGGFPYQVPLSRNRFDPVHIPEVHRCIECNRSFQSSNSLSQHREAKHSDERNICITCHKSFRTSASLDQHQRDKPGHGAPVSKRKQKELSFASRKRRKL